MCHNTSRTYGTLAKIEYAFHQTLFPRAIGTRLPQDLAGTCDSHGMYGIEITTIVYSIGDQHCWTIIIILADDTFTIVVASQA